MPFDVDSVRGIATPAGLPFRLCARSGTVLRASDLKRSVEPHTQVLAFAFPTCIPRT
jgi:hypothetical protein